MRNSIYRLLMIIWIIPLLFGCGKGDDNKDNEETKTDTYKVITTSEYKVGDEIPSPDGPVVLIITGKIGVTNVEDSLQFDMETLEAMGLVEYKARDEEGTGREAVFRGILLSHLFEIAQVIDAAEAFEAVALNDYVIEIPLDDVNSYPVLLATTIDGQTMNVEELGPTRIVYPNLSYDLDSNRYNPRWIWQVKSFNIK